MPFAYGTTVDAGEALTNWTAGTSVTLTVNNVVPPKQGSNCIHVEFTATGLRLITLDLPSALDFDDTVFSWWFYYVSGKGDQFLQGNTDSIRIRAFTTTGATGTAYAEWDLKGPLPDGDGHFSLNAAWNKFFVSGSNPTRLGAGGAPTYSNINSVQFVFDVLATNGSPGFSADPLWFGLDFVIEGKNIVITGGTDVAPLDFDALFDWSNGGTNKVTDPDYGLVQKQDDLVTTIAGIQIGDGTTTTYFRDTNITLFYDLYGGVNLEYRIKNNVLGHRLGTKDVGTDATYAKDGCVIFAPVTRRDGQSGSDIIDFILEGGVSFNNVNEEYGGKRFRFRNVIYGLAAGEPGSNECIGIDYAEPNNVEIRDGGDWQDCLFHDTTNTGNIGAVHVAPNSSSGIKVFRNPKGFIFEDSFTIAGLDPIEGWDFTDQVTIDATIRDPNDVDFVDCIIDDAKIERVV